MARTHVDIEGKITVTVAQLYYSRKYLMCVGGRAAPSLGVVLRKRALQLAPSHHTKKAARDRIAMSAVSPSRSTSRGDGYALLNPNSDEALAQAAARQPMRPTTIVVIVLALLSFFYVTTSLSTTANSPWSTRTASVAKTIFGRYEKLKLQNENAALKEKLEQMEAMLHAQQSDAMRRAASSAAGGGASAGGGAAAQPPVKAYPSMADAAQTPGSASAADSASRLSAAPADEKQKKYEGLQQMLRALPGSPASLKASADAAAANASKAENPNRLTPELIRSRCDKHNIILVTFVNSKRADYGYTWAAHIRRLGLSNYLVGAMDLEVGRAPVTSATVAAATRLPPLRPRYHCVHATTASTPPLPPRHCCLHATAASTPLLPHAVASPCHQALAKLKARSIPTFDMNSGLTTADYGWGTKNFRQLGLRKTELIITLLRAGAQSLYWPVICHMGTLHMHGEP